MNDNFFGPWNFVLKIATNRADAIKRQTRYKVEISTPFGSSEEVSAQFPAVGAATFPPRQKNRRAEREICPKILKQFG